MQGMYQSAQDLHPGFVCSEIHSAIRIQMDCCNFPLSQLQIAHSSVACCSSKREPLGKGYKRGHKVPDGLGTKKPFGVAIHAKVSSQHCLLKCFTANTV